MMNGRIWIESEAGKGSTFFFTFEAKRASEKTPVRNFSKQDRKSIRILVTDDDPEAREYFSDIIHHFGYLCDSASGADEARSLIEKNGAYSLYFIDYKMPGTNGIELSRWIKEQESQVLVKSAEKLSPIKSVVIMTSATEWSIIENEAKDAGVERFLPKPFFPSAINDYINEYLGFEHHLAQNSTTDDETDCFKGYQILLAEDVQINQEIVLALLEPTSLAIDCANNGAEAVEKYREAPDKYAMIFMDVQMPEMDGFEATRRIRSIEGGFRHIPIVAMTANVFKEDIEKCLASGMDDHVGKPIDIKEVIKKVRQYLK
jgi:CheY-like chemotaxis protein